MLIQRVFVALEKALHKGFVHNRYGCRGFIVRCRKAPPAQDGYAKILKVVGAHAVPRGARFFVQLGSGIMASYQDEFAPVVGKRVVKRQPGSLHSRQTVEPFLKLAVERG